RRSRPSSSIGPWDSSGTWPPTRNPACDPAPSVPSRCRATDQPNPVAAASPWSQLGSMPPREPRQRTRERRPQLLRHAHTTLEIRAAHDENVALAVEPRVDAADESVAEEDRHGVVTIAATRGRRVDLPPILEPEEILEPSPMPHQVVERRQKPRDGRRRLATFFLERLDVRFEHPVATLHPFDLERHQLLVPQRLLPLGRRKRTPPPEMRIVIVEDPETTAVLREQQRVRLLGRH